MKQLILSTSLPQLIAEVSLTTAYLGVKQAPEENPGNHFDRLAVIDSDKELMTRFAKESLSELAERLKGAVARVTFLFSEQPVGLTLTLSDSYDEQLSPSVRGNFDAYMLHAVTSRWLRLVMPEKEGVWLAESQRLLSEIVSTLCHRNPPRRLNKA